MKSDSSRILPAEWHPQSAIQLTWPHEDTDWAANLAEVINCFVQIAEEISKRQKLLICCREVSQVKSLLNTWNSHNLIFCEVDSNDSWARDHAGITVLVNGKPVILDFGFNGWAGKYSADKDNQITQMLFEYGAFAPGIQIEGHLDFILEGGSIESDGQGSILTTSKCLLSKGRNDQLNKKEIEKRLLNALGTKRVLFLEHGRLIGDDTDGHIDTLARFCSLNTIVYVKCSDPEDEHFEELALMENELKGFRDLNGDPYNLVPLPMAQRVYYQGNRLPVTYANFLIINDAVLIPFYESPKDELAREILQSVFPDREVLGINCTSLIKQNGSLHCVTMQYPEGVLS